MNKYGVKYWSWLSVFSVSVAFWAQLIWILTH